MGDTTVGTRRPLYTAVCRQLFLTFGIATLAGAAVAEDVQNQWSCHADSDGNWVCATVPISGTPYRRPEPRVAAPAPGQVSDEESHINPTRNLDWVPLEQLSVDEQERVRPNCCGAYIEPPRNYPESDLTPEEASLRVSADSTEARGNVATLEGDVQVSQGYRQVRSNKAVVDQEKRVIELMGNINYREPGVLITGEEARLDMDSREARLTDAGFVLHDSGVRGSAKTLQKGQDDVIYIDNATYTTCEPDNNAWQLKTSDVDIDTIRNMAVARNVRLEVKDIPVLYIPWIRFPTSDNRATGLLFPVLVAGNDNGIDYSQPIYLNLAPNYDATLTPRFIQYRGAMMEAEARYLNDWSTTTVSGGYLWDDDGGDVGKETTASGERLPYEGEDRWLIGVGHKGGMGHAWDTYIDYNDVSDIDYFRDLDTTTLEVNSQSHLNQEIAAGYTTRHWRLGVKAQEFETIIRDGLEQYKQLPRIDANGRYRFGHDLILSLRQHFVAFDHSEDDVFGSGTPLTRDADNTTVTGSRLRADYGITWDKEWLWGFFKPSAKVKAIRYDLDTPLAGQTDESPDILVPVTSLDTGLFFENQDSWFGDYTQTLEPRLYYLKSEYEDQSAIPNFDTSDLTFSYQQLFRDDRFSGSDRIGDTEQLTLGVTTRLIDGDTGIERLRFSFGQIYYFDDRRVTLNPLEQDALVRDSSDIAAELSAGLWSHWRLQGDILFNEQDSDINKGSASLRYNNREGTLFNLAYRYTRRDTLQFDLSQNIDVINTDIDQLDLSFALPVTDAWKFLGRYNHDFNSGQELEVFAGIEYSSCCWRTSVVARRWIDRDDTLLLGTETLDHQTGLFLQIQFIGLAGTGTRVNNILSEGIYGYQPPEP